MPATSDLGTDNLAVTLPGLRMASETPTLLALAHHLAPATDHLYQHLLHQLLRLQPSTTVYVVVTPVPDPPDQDTLKAEAVILLDARPVMAVGGDGGGAEGNVASDSL